MMVVHSGDLVRKALCLVQGAWPMLGIVRPFPTLKLEVRALGPISQTGCRGLLHSAERQRSIGTRRVGARGAGRVGATVADVGSVVCFGISRRLYATINNNTVNLNNLLIEAHYSGV